MSDVPQGPGPPIEEPEVERVPHPAPGAAGGGRRPLSPGRRTVALAIAIAADAVQWVAFPLFMTGALSPADDMLDVFVAVAMTSLLGWHWAFLPTFIAEIVPFVDLVPSWTLAVWLATRGRSPGARP